MSVFSLYCIISYIIWFVDMCCIVNLPVSIIFYESLFLLDNSDKASLPISLFVFFTTLQALNFSEIILFPTHKILSTAFVNWIFVSVTVDCCFFKVLIHISVVFQQSTIFFTLKDGSQSVWEGNKQTYVSCGRMCQRWA